VFLLRRRLGPSGILRAASAALDAPSNPLQLGIAVIFAGLFVAITLATNIA
jgi:hypothetical protein